MYDPRKIFKKIEVIPDWVAGHYIQWTIDPFFRGTRPYNFSLEISETLEFKETIAVKENLGDVFFAIDDTNLKQAWGSNYTYRVVLATSDGKKYPSMPVSFGSTGQEHRKYAMAADIIRKEMLMCRYAGTSAWLLKRKSYSSKSSNVTYTNIDPVSGIPIADEKNQDYGVGIDGGYYDPVPCAFYIEVSSQDKQLDQTGLGVKETYQTMIRLPGYPIIEIRDIVCVVNDGQRHSIQTKNIKNFPGSDIPLIQKATIVAIPSTDSVYSIPLPK
jgi:hypothetical protein